MTDKYYDSGLKIESPKYDSKIEYVPHPVPNEEKPVVVTMMEGEKE